MRHHSSDYFIGLLAAISLLCFSSATSAEPPNIVFIYIDDMGYGDLGCYGNSKLETPHIDSLASEGIRFRQFYVGSPICSASRVTITTGQFPSRHRIHSFLSSRAANRQRGMVDFLDPATPTLAKQLKGAGYATGHFGKWHMGGGRDVGDAPLPQEYGFDESFASFEGLGDRLLMPNDVLSAQSEKLGRGKITWARKNQFTEIYVDRAISFVHDRQTKPFYLQLWLNDVHDPLSPSREQLRSVADQDWTGPSRDYAAVVKNVDHQIGRLLAAIDRLNLTENTLVVLSSDNGPTAWPTYEQMGVDAPGSTGGLRGRKWSLYEGGIREPLIVRWPGNIPEGKVDSTSVVAGIDFLPTLCSLAGIDVSKLELDGIDVSDALRGNPIKDRPPLFWEYGRDSSYLQPARPIDRSPNLAVRDGKWKLLMNADGSRVELYNIEESPQEFHNVAGLHPAVRDRLSGMVQQWKDKLPGYKESQVGDPKVHDLEANQSLVGGEAPKVDRAAIEISATITPQSKNGVIVAHGGEAEGYSLYIKDGTPHFAVRSRSALSTLATETQLSVGERVSIKASLAMDGAMSVTVDDNSAGEGAKSALLHNQPIDPLDVGRDQHGTVGDYDGEFPFEGDIADLRLTITRNTAGDGPRTLVTRWAGDMNPKAPWPEYPRPQMVRDNWQNLNGYWRYAVRPREENRPANWDGRIVVPFPAESILSDVWRRIGGDNRLWYRREFEPPAHKAGERLLLHFGAVDWEAEVWINGQPVGKHQGGYDPFTFDITDSLKREGAQEIVVAVWDPTDQGPQPRGKQTNQPQGIMYTPVSGIWQSVWCERVPATHISSLQLTPHVDLGELEIKVLTSNQSGQRVRVQLLSTNNGEEQTPLDVEPTEGKTNDALRVKLPSSDEHRWSPEEPWLYSFEVELIDPESGEVVDRVLSYAGLRSVTLGEDAQGVTRIHLNGKPIYQLGLLDQGWWPDGLYTAPTDDALRYDLELTKQLGFNMARKHVKVEPARWYYWADRLGVLVWQDMPSPLQNIGERNLVRPGEPDLEVSDEYSEIFRRELRAMIQSFRNHPSIVAWVPFNEGWGQHNTNATLAWVKELDPSRLVGGPSGWEDRGEGDLLDMHKYPAPGMPELQSGRAAVLGEYGGLGLPIRGHTWMDDRNWGYRSFDSRGELQQEYANLARQLPALVQRGLNASVYTQTTDVEGEVNGVTTYDRNVTKLQPSDVVPLHESVIEHLFDE